MRKSNLRIREEIALLWTAKDADGNQSVYSDQIAHLGLVFDAHDYAKALESIDADYMTAMGIPIDGTAAETQRAIREFFSRQADMGPVHFHAHSQEAITMSLYAKDGNPGDQSQTNLGVSILKHSGKLNLYSVRVAPDEPALPPLDMELPTSVIEIYAEEYLKNHADENGYSEQAMISYAINQTIIKIMTEQAGPILHKAVMVGDESLVVEQLAQKIDVNQQAEFGWTPLLYASAQGYPRIARMLLDAGAIPDIGNVFRITPLMYGARYGNVEVCQILLEFGANVDLQDSLGLTALMTATRDGHVEVAELLMDAEADTAIAALNGMTVLDMAHQNGQGEIAKQLRKRAKGSQPN